MWFLSDTYSLSQFKLILALALSLDWGNLSKDTTAPQLVPARTSASLAFRSSSGSQDPFSAICRLCRKSMSGFFPTLCPPLPSSLGRDHSHKLSAQPPSICFLPSHRFFWNLSAAQWF